MIQSNLIQLRYLRVISISSMEVQHNFYQSKNFDPGFWISSNCLLHLYKFFDYLIRRRDNTTSILFINSLMVGILAKTSSRNKQVRSTPA